MKTRLKVGSPPHTWRKYTSVSLNQVEHRITSTYVEKISLGGSGDSKTRDHLHIRGENPMVFTTAEVKDRITSTYVEKICDGEI